MDDDTNQINEDGNGPAPQTAAGRRRRHIPIPPVALTMALVVTTAIVAAGTDPKLPPYVGD
jgi:hypothetical protein